MSGATTQRVPLADFQADLARKLAASAQRPVAAGWLGVSWRGVRALVPLTQVAEIAYPSALQRLPHGQPWVVGVASVRGGLALVVDWVRLLGLEAPNAPSRWGQDSLYWLCLNPALGVQAAFCVDQLWGLREVQDIVFTPAPSPVPGAVQVGSDAEGQLWWQLDLQALCASAAFLDVRAPMLAGPVASGPQGTR